MTKELKQKLREIAELIYNNYAPDVESAMEEAEEEGNLCIAFDDFSEFEARSPDIEAACWARGLVIELDGNCYIVREDDGK